MISNIILLTGPIISGKTSKLYDLLQNRSDVRGFLTPDINALRQVHILPKGSKTELPMQADGPGKDTIEIGRYHFYTSAFEAMKSELRGMVEKPAEWNIIDELGKLELKGEGLCPEIDQVLAQWKKPGQAGRLIVVIRDELLEASVSKYGLDQAIIIQKEDAALVF